MHVTPLGGLGEIGRNSCLIEHRNSCVLIDAGILFPDDDQPGVDVILPDYSPIKDVVARLDAILLTHGHLDHIGAMPYLLRDAPNTPVYGTELTLALVKRILDEHKITADLRVISAGDTVTCGTFTVTFVTVNHSIPDAVAIHLKTDAGTILNTGDFKMDQFPLDGKLTDLPAFADLGRDGIDLFMTDSTNADVPGFTAAETDLAPAINHAFAVTSGRIIVSTFASHIHRIQQIVDAATRHHRRVAFYGRSMVTNMAIAQELGYLKIPAGVEVSAAQAETMPPEKVAIIATGSQGETLAALSRIAAGTHRRLSIGTGDTVLLASSAVPGNETSISRLIDTITGTGANIIHKGNAHVHTSGHASAGELAYCYNIVRPRNVMPVHGEPRHLVANANIAARCGVDRTNIVIAKNGDTVEVANGTAKIVGHVNIKHVFVENTHTAHETTVADRVALAVDGHVTVVALVDPDTGLLTEPADLLIRGLTTTKPAVERLRARLSNTFEQCAAEDIRTLNEQERHVTATVHRWAQHTYRRAPVVTPVIIDA